MQNHWRFEWGCSREVNASRLRIRMSEIRTCLVRVQDAKWCGFERVLLEDRCEVLALTRGI
jgi:hypothetical protein